jgi:hypothetical protein
MFLLACVPVCLIDLVAQFLADVDYISISDNYW